MAVYPTLVQHHQRGHKALAVLLDPDKLDDTALERIVRFVEECPVDYLLVGGSLMTTERLDAVVRYAKAHSSKPVVLFPGSVAQVHGEADALLLLSVISGRNPELLIGQHVVAAPRIKALGLETISTGYMLVDSGRTTTALYMSQTLPIPAHKPEIAAATALAGEMLGMQAMYLDGGSGALEPVPEAMIRAVRKAVNVPVIVGGGIRSEAAAQAAWDAGADVVVVGTAFEEDPSLLFDIAAASRNH